MNQPSVREAADAAQSLNRLFRGVAIVGELLERVAGIENLESEAKARADAAVAAAAAAEENLNHLNQTVSDIEQSNAARIADAQATADSIVRTAQDKASVQLSEARRRSEEIIEQANVIAGQIEVQAQATYGAENAKLEELRVQIDAATAELATLQAQVADAEAKRAKILEAAQAILNK
jgi:polyhydroxyalkanoate synthesis regulator phasin